MSGPRQGYTYLGLGPQQLQIDPTILCGLRVAYPTECYQTPVLDLTQTITGLEYIPARPAHFPVQMSRFWVIISKSGTQVTPVSYKLGSNLTHDNFVSGGATPSNADANTTPAGFPYCAAGTGGAGVAQRPTNKPIFFDITAPAAGTGSFSLKAFLATFVMWMPSGGA